MVEALDILKKFAEVFKLQVAPWLLVLLLFLLLIRKPIARAGHAIVDGLARSISHRWRYEQFAAEYRRVIAAEHCHLRLVGIRTEEERRPHILDSFVPISIVPEGEDLKSVRSFEKHITSNTFSVLLGEPGSGKTTLLSYFVVSLCAEDGISIWRRALARIRSTSPAGDGPATSRWNLPIYLPLRRCLISNEGLLDDVVHPDTRVLPPLLRSHMPPGFLQDALRQRDVILLLDGLDEVASQKDYRRVAEKINDFVHMHPLIPVVVTCRVAGWRGELDSKVSVLRALPLDSDQRYEFVHRWFRAVGAYTAVGREKVSAETLTRARTDADRLLALVVRKQQLRDISSNPLVLSLICLVYRQKRDLPRGRFGLYEECVDILLNLWDRIDKDLDQLYPTSDQKRLLLRRLAYHVHSTGKRDIRRSDLEDFVRELKLSGLDNTSAASIVRQLEVRSGLVVERAIDVLAFSHLTFQEYFVVQFLRCEPGASVDLANIHDWNIWKEPVLLLCGVEPNANALICQLGKANLEIATQAICEIDPALLDVEVAVEIIDTFFRRHNTHAKTITFESVALLRVENTEVRSRVKVHLSRILGTNDAMVTSSVLASLSTLETAEAAQMILQLYDAVGPDLLQPVKAALIRIGEPALYEVLDYASSHSVPEELCFSVIKSCSSLESTKALWNRYQLTPPAGLEIEWALAWGIRIRYQNHDASIRETYLPHHEIGDPVFWPYGRCEKTALAAVVERCIIILGDEAYANKLAGAHSRMRRTPDLDEAGEVGAAELCLCSWRILVPIGVKAVEESSVGAAFWRVLGLRGDRRRWARHVGSNIPSDLSTDPTEWLTLKPYIERQSKKRQRRLGVCRYGGLLLIVGCCLALYPAVNLSVSSFLFVGVFLIGVRWAAGATLYAWERIGQPNYGRSRLFVHVFTCSAIFSMGLHEFHATRWPFATPVIGSLFCCSLLAYGFGSVFRRNTLARALSRYEEGAEVLREFGQGQALPQFAQKRLPAITSARGDHHISPLQLPAERTADAAEIEDDSDL